MKVIRCDFCGKEPAIETKVVCDEESFWADACLSCLKAFYEDIFYSITNATTIRNHIHYRKQILQTRCPVTVTNT